MGSVLKEVERKGNLLEYNKERYVDKLPMIREKNEAIFLKNHGKEEGSDGRQTLSSWVGVRGMR